MHIWLRDAGGFALANAGQDTRAETMYGGSILSRGGATHTLECISATAYGW